MESSVIKEFAKSFHEMRDKEILDFLAQSNFGIQDVIEKNVEIKIVHNASTKADWVVLNNTSKELTPLQTYFERFIYERKTKTT